MVVITQGMVNIYNGSTFEYIHLNAERFYALSGYHGFHRSYVDGEGRLWIKNYGKLILVDIRKERFEPKADSILAAMGAREPLADLFMDQHQGFWMLTKTGKLLYKNSNQKVIKVFFNERSLGDNASDPLYDLAVLNKQLFLFFRSGLFKCYDLVTRKFLFSGDLEEAFPHSYNRTAFVVPGNHTLYILRNGETGIMQVYNANSHKWNTVLQPEYGLNCLSVNHKGELFLSCRFGLWRFSSDLARRQFIPTLHLLDGRSIDTEVSTLYNDTQGGFWVGTLNRGLLYYHPDRFKFSNIGKSRFPVKKPGDLSVTCFGNDASGRLLVGTAGGLFKYKPAEEQLTRSPGMLGNIRCNAIYTDKQQRTWICTTKGLYKIEDDRENYFDTGDINCITQTGIDEFYLGSEEEGLLKFQPSSGVKEPVKATAINNTAVTRLKECIIWEGRVIGISNAGLMIYDPALKTSISGQHLPVKLRRLFNTNNQQYTCLLADSRGLLWLGTEDGLNVWDNRNGTLCSLHNDEGLINNSVKAVVEDNEHELWVSTSNGVSRVRVNKNQGQYQFAFDNFNNYDGIIDNEFIPRSAFISQHNNLYFGGIDGFNELDLQRKTENDKKLKPLFVKLQLDGKEIVQGEAYEGNVILTRSIAATDHLTLNHDQNFLTLGFSALNYVNPSQTYYQYYLDGVDQVWRSESAPDGLGFATYTNLSPGTYVFNVRAGRSAKDLSGQVARMVITIKAPWWKSPLAILCYILIISALAYLVISRNLVRIKARRIKKQREELDELKFRFITNMSHELRTPLTLILTPLDVLLKKFEDVKVKTQLTGIYNNALNLLSLVNQLLDFRRLEISGESLHLSYCNIEDYIKTLSNPFEELAHSKDIHFNWQCEVEQAWLYIDRDKTSIMINNLLSNAFKFTATGGRVNLKVDLENLNNLTDKVFRIEVTDTGCGVAEKYLPVIFDRFFQADNQPEGNNGNGIGLHLVREYARMHGGEVSVESQAGKGSRFTIAMPAKFRTDTSASQETGATRDDRSNLKILIVEDNWEFREFLANNLSASYTVMTAVNGSEGLDKISEQMPDLVISDIMMPEMDGITMCKELKKNVRISHIPVILLTARSTDDAKLQGYDAGADAYISKPFNMDILMLRIRNLIDQHEQRKQLFKKATVIQPASVTTTDVDERLIQNALKCIEKNLANSAYSVEQFSSDMNMDRTGLYRKLLATVGQSPSDFIRSVRLKNAAQLILKRAHSITEISIMVGFSNVAYFSKCFHDEYGVKPSQYITQVSTGKIESGRK